MRPPKNEFYDIKRLYSATDTDTYGLATGYAKAVETKWRGYHFRNAANNELFVDEQGISQQTLAVRTAKDKACLTNLMLNLERKGYVCRHEDPKDRRNKLVYLTEKGEEFHQWIAPVLTAYYERLEQILGTEKLKQTDELLKELQHAIETY